MGSRITTAISIGSEAQARPLSSVLRIVDSHPSAVLMFADVVGFTTLSSQVSAEELVHSLNDLVTHADNACTSLGVEKVKTIGDCYMAVSVPTSSLPVDLRHSCKQVLRLANRLHQVAPRVRLAGQPLQMRAGMAEGPVVGGVIGVSKFAYDFWGDTVNFASRMESSGVAGATQVTGTIHELLKHEFEFSTRGMIHLKGKGDVEAFIHFPKSRPNLELSIISCS
eukprot:NODE_1203_length_1242_cov_57.979044_g980_i0.p1 GENE.NODE_1203_length_1242_cov_57.979044_g980_i0~~NODE_1203_length_1242_cov_57.979044_g980_i0.p1  ORF type:complete len:224 (-),score=53.44 NODE_1203_length_1242_cov_57.979044_g980_i0:100-771(-)